MPARILLAEDDPKQARLVRLYLEREGHAVQTVTDGRSAIERFRAVRPDLVVLDVMLPRVSGLDVCRVIRVDMDTPILMLTARSGEDDLLLGLELGADDYLIKPYSPRELVGRIRALLRRSSNPAPPSPVRVGALEIDAQRFEVLVDGVKTAVTAREFAILELLAGSPGRVFTRTEIIDKVFAFDTDVQDRTVDAHVRNLRRKLGERAVQTVYGRGYRAVG